MSQASRKADRRVLTTKADLREMGYEEYVRGWAGLNWLNITSGGGLWY
jgi:hypothetical protein